MDDFVPQQVEMINLNLETERNSMLEIETVFHLMHVNLTNNIDSLRSIYRFESW